MSAVDLPPSPRGGLAGFADRHGDLIFVVFLAASMAFAALPGLRGDYVYDDRRMIDHPFLDDPSDIAAVFSRNSADYLHPDPREGHVGAFTYRPFAMLTLVATEVLTHSARVHHAVSYWLELASATLAYVAMRKLGARRLVAMGAIACFALSPALAESWVFINGRADLLAGLFVSAFALALASLRGGGSRVGSGIAALITASLAMSSKETAFVALVGVIFVVAATRGADLRTRRAVVLVGALSVAASVVLYVGLHRYSAARFEGAAGASTPLDPRSLLERAPRLLTLGFGSLAWPLARPMRILSYELTRPLGLLDAVGGCAFALAMVVGIARRSVPLVLATLTGAAVLVPVGFVADAFWLGFDRYLVLVALPLLLALPDASAKPTKRPIAMALGLLVAAHLVASGVALRGTAATYTDQATFARAMMRARPADPTGWLLLAMHQGVSGDHEAMLSTLGSAPEAIELVPQELSRIGIYFVLQDGDQAFGRIDRLLARHPDDVRVYPMAINRLILLTRPDEAMMLAERARRDPRGCLEVKASLRDVRRFPGLDEELGAKIDRFLEHPCPGE